MAYCWSHETFKDALRCPFCHEEDHKMGRHALRYDPFCAICRDTLVANNVIWNKEVYRYTWPSH